VAAAGQFADGLSAGRFLVPPGEDADPGPGRQREMGASYAEVIRAAAAAVAEPGMVDGVEPLIILLDSVKAAPALHQGSPRGSQQPVGREPPAPQAPAASGGPGLGRAREQAAVGRVPAAGYDGSRSQNKPS
jgi:hypothetical protein